MTAANSIHSVTVEVLDIIVQHLAFEDTCSLRLTSRDLAAQVTQTSFKSCFQIKTIRVTEANIKAFAGLTEQAWIGSAIRHLTIVGIATWPQEPNQQGVVNTQYKRETVEFLSTALTNIRRHSNRGRLCSLSLDVELQDRPVGAGRLYNHLAECQISSECANVTARITADATKASRLVTERLDLYSNTEQCAISPSILAQFTDSLGMQACTSLSLNVCVFSKDQTVSEGSKQIVRMIEATERLEHLGIRCYRQEWFDYKEDIHSHDIPAAISQMTRQLGALNSLSLRGIHSTERGLLSLLSRQSGLISLILEEIHLADGIFLPIFTCIDQMPLLESLYLNDLWEDRLIHFLGNNGRPHYPSKGSLRPSWLRRTPADRTRRRPIRYQKSKGRALGSPQAAIWRRTRARLYGPPSRSG